MQPARTRWEKRRGEGQSPSGLMTKSSMNIGAKWTHRKETLDCPPPPSEARTNYSSRATKQGCMTPLSCLLITVATTCLSEKTRRNLSSSRSNKRNPEDHHCLFSALLGQAAFPLSSHQGYFLERPWFCGLPQDHVTVWLCSQTDGSAPRCPCSLLPALGFLSNSPGSCLTLPPETNAPACHAAAQVPGSPLPSPSLTTSLQLSPGNTSTAGSAVILRHCKVSRWLRLNLYLVIWLSNDF